MCVNIYKYIQLKPRKSIQKKFNKLNMICIHDMPVSKVQEKS